MKEKILKKAIDLFLNFGFKSVTMDDIAKELAISKKTIYSHFSTKLKLVKATTFHVFEQINSGINNICSANYNAIEEEYLVKSLITKQLRGEKKSPQYQLQKYYPNIFETLKQKQFEAVNQCISNNLKKGIKTGLYRKDINIDFITRLYFNGIMGIKNEDIFSRDQFTIPYLMDNYLEYHIRAIATEKGLEILQKTLKK